MKREIGIWQWAFNIQADYMRGGMGWRSIAIGYFKILELPEQGAVLAPGQYKGVLIRFRYWLPWEKFF